MRRCNSSAIAGWHGQACRMFPAIARRPSQRIDPSCPWLHRSSWRSTRRQCSAQIRQGVAHGNGGVGTGTISERELLFSSLSATVPVASTIAVTGLHGSGEEKDCGFTDALNPFTVWSTSLTLTTKLPAAACPLFLIHTRTPIGSPGMRQLVFCNSMRMPVIVRSGRICVGDIAKEHSPCGAAIRRAVECRVPIRICIERPACGGGDKIQAADAIAKVYVWRYLCSNSRPHHW